MVSKVKLEVEGTKEINEIGVALKGILLDAVKLSKDGWKTSEDLPALMISNYKALMLAVEGAAEAGKEVEDSPVDAIMGALVPISQAIEVVLEMNKAKEVKAAEVGNKKTEKSGK